MLLKVMLLKMQLKNVKYTLKINEFIQSSQTVVYFFSPQLLLNIPVFELNNQENYCQKIFEAAIFPSSHQHTDDANLTFQ